MLYNDVWNSKVRNEYGNISLNSVSENVESFQDSEIEPRTNLKGYIGKLYDLD